jgi:hypothetical protein
MKGFRLLFALVATLSLLLLGTGTGSAASASASASGLKCSGTLASPGSIAPGTYSSIMVVGFCLGPPTGNVIVTGDVIVTKAAVLAANYPAFAPGAPEGDATWLVKGDVRVGHGATLLLGCEPHAGCVNTTFDAVKGNVNADGALGVILHSNIIGGNVSYSGGGGGVNCTPGFGPFSFGVFSDAEDKVINGSLHVSGLRSCWFGVFRNIIMGNATVTGNQFANSDATEVANNQVFGNLACFNNVPVAQFGDSAQPPNVVFGAIRGECIPLSTH